MYLLYFNIYTKILLTRLHDKKVITQPHVICGQGLTKKSMDEKIQMEKHEKLLYIKTTFIQKNVNMNIKI